MTPELVLKMELFLCFDSVQSAFTSHPAAESFPAPRACVIVFLFATFQGYPGEDNRIPGPPGPLGEPVGFAFLSAP